jgi:hypothetical protein
VLPSAKRYERQGRLSLATMTLFFLTWWGLGTKINMPIPINTNNNPPPIARFRYQDVMILIHNLHKEWPAFIDKDDMEIVPQQRRACKGETASKGLIGRRKKED